MTGLYVIGAICAVLAALAVVLIALDLKKKKTEVSNTQGGAS